MNVDFNIEVDNSEEIIAKNNEAVLRALENIGQMIENNAAALAPVDTGNLRNSITHQVDESNHRVIVGSAVEYAPAQEYGFYKDGKQHSAANGGRGYLHPAIEDHLDEYKQIFAEELKS